MGKIFTRVTPGMAGSHFSGIDVLVVDQLFGALSGQTSITKIDKDPASGSLLIEAENDNFLDGTEIVGQWNTGVQTPNPRTAVPQYTVFSGVKIIDPPAQPQTLTSNSTYTYTVPHQWNHSIGIGGSGGNGSNHVTIQVPGLSAGTKSADDKCVCGTDAVGGGHSSYCPKK